VALPCCFVIKGMIHTYYNHKLYSTTTDISDLPYKTSGAGKLPYTLKFLRHVYFTVMYFTWIFVLFLISRMLYSYWPRIFMFLISRKKLSRPKNIVFYQVAGMATKDFTFCFKCNATSQHASLPSSISQAMMN